MKNLAVQPHTAEPGETILCHHSESCAALEEIEKLKAENAALKQLVATDALTGLFNRRHMFMCLEQEYERSQRSNLPTTIALIDLDYFKAINDTYGHRAGDAVLTKISSIIKNTIRQLDIACRYGGEEFCVIFPSTYLLTAQIVAERIRKSIESAEIIFDDKKMHVTASIGLDTYCKKSNTSMNEIIENADKQLYKAKELGRNQICANTPKLSNSSQMSHDEKDALYNTFAHKKD